MKALGMLAAIVLALPLAGCGGGSAASDPDSAAPPPPPPSPAPPPPTGPVPLEGTLTRGIANPIVRNGPESFDVIKAGPRSVVKVGPSDYRMWYEAIENSSNDTRVAYATSTDGTNWTKRGIVMGFTAPWEVNEVSSTTVIFDADAKVWKMWYHGGGNDGRRYIGYATSPDGIAWTKFAGNPVLSPGPAGSWDDKYISDAKVIRLSSTDYRLWYKGVRVSTQVGQVGYAISSDGVTWTKHAGNPVFTPGTPGSWDDASINSPAIQHDRGLFHMWYPGIGNEATLPWSPGDGIGYASSVDGVSWTRGMSNPVLLPNSNASAPDRELGDTIDAYWDVDRYRVVYGAFNMTVQPVMHGMAEAYVKGVASP